jgi:hypothetical protein
MRSLTFRLLLLISILLLSTGAFAHDVTITGTQNFSSLDGSSSDHDGVVNGVFTVSDGNLAINGTVNCNDDTTTSACSMSFVASGNVSVGTTGALFAENRSGGGTGGAISVTAGGNISVATGGIVSTDSKSSSGATGGNITANAGGTISLASGSTLDAGSSNAAAGKITLAASGAVSIDGNVLSGPSRTLLAGRLGAGAALDGGTANQVGGAIAISSSSFVQPSVVIGSNASVVSQGENSGTGAVTITGCGIEVRGLVAALSKKDSAATVSIRSGQGLLIDGRDLGVTGATLGRTGRIRGDAPTGNAVNKHVDLFAAQGVQVLGPAAGSSTLYVVTSLPGLHDSKSYGGLIRIMSTGGAITASGNVIDNGRESSGDTGGTIQISAKDDVTLATAVIRSVGDFSTGNPNRGGGTISVRSYSGNVVWTNGVGDVRPVGSSSGLATADQGHINLTACGTVNTTGTSFPVLGVPTFVFPNIQSGVCSPAAPSLPAGVPAFVTCNTPPVANDVAASTNEDNSVTITLSGTDADGDPLTFSIVSGPTNGSLGPIVPVNSTSATVVYSPNANYNGGDSFVYQANDGNGGTDNATVTITITAVNDAPSFQAGPDVSSAEDAGAQTVSPWATSISAGPADEAGQTVTFNVTGNTNPGLFSVQPSVSSTGVLTYTAAANANGSATITITLSDNGGTANGGADTSGPQSFTITITAVNDPPTFTGGPDQTVNEDAGAQSVANWATAISAGPNEGSQTVAFSVTNNTNPSLFSVAPAISPAGTLTYTPAANVSGTASITVVLTDDGGGSDTSAPYTFTITVNPVNDAPSFTSGGDVTVLEDSGAYSAAWATAISAGPADESGQAVSFNITGNSNPSLFSAGPAISPSGVLSFTLNADAFGSSLITVTLSDNGGTTNGGVDTSAPQSFTINVTAVNDAPSFTAGGNVTVNEDSGAYSAPWASGISAGPNEGGQTVSFNVSNSNNALFSAQPSISPAGVLTFTPAPNAFGTVTVTVSLSDNGGTANGGVDTSAAVTFTITINGINDAPTAANDSWETEGNTELRVDLAAGLTPHVADTTPSGTGVLDNDADTVEGDPFSITSIVGCADVVAPFDCTFGDGSKLSMQANGSFSWVPGPGATSGSFQYVVTDNPAAGTPASATGTVTITVHDEIWYVQGGATGGNGTSVAPFGDFTSLNGAGDVDAPGAYIFVQTSAVSGSISLEANQRLWGEGVGLIINRNLNGNGSPATLVAPGIRPTVSSVADTVSVNNVTGTEIAGLNLSSALGNAIDVTSNPFGANAASAAIYDNVILGAGVEGIDVNGGGSLGTTVTVNNTPITSTGNGFNATSVGGTVAVSYSNGSITSVSGRGIYVDGSAGGNLFVTGLSNVTINGNTAGDGVRIQSASFDATPGGAFNVVSAGVTAGAIGNGVGGSGVVLSNVSGNVAFSTLTGYAGSGGAVVVTGGGAGLTITSANGVASAPTGVGVSVTNATIGAANLTFTSVSSSNTANGILLNNTGTSGGLVVTGTGPAGSGGTILNTTSDSILLNSTGGVSLSGMKVLGSSESGVLGTNVTGLSFNNVQLTNNGNDSADEGIKVTNLWGTSSWTNVQVSGSAHNHVFIDNTSGTLTSLNVSGSSFSNTGAFGANGFLLQARGTAVVTSVVVNGSTFANAASAAVLIQSQNTAVINGATVSGNTITANGQGLNFTQANSASLKFSALTNTLTGTGSHAINAFSSSASTSGTLTGTIQGNQIGNAGVPDSGSAFGNGIRVLLQAQTRGIFLVDNNVVRQTPFGRGIEVVGQSAPGLDATITTNNVDPQDVSGFPQAAIFVAADDIGTGGLVRADIRGNVVPAASNTYDYPTFDGTAPNLVYEELSGATAQLVDTPPASPDGTSQLTSTNSGSAYANPGVALIAGPLTLP